MVRGEDIMPLPQDVREGARDMGREWKSVCDGIADTQLIADLHDIEGWIGQAKDAYMDQIRSLQSHALDVIDRLLPIRKALDDWADALENAITTTIPDLWDQYDTANAVHDRLVMDFNERVAESKLEPYLHQEPMSDAEINWERNRMAQIRQGDLVQITTAYRRVMETLDQAAGDAAQAIRTQIDCIIQPSVVDQGRIAIGASLFDDIPLVDAQAEWDLANEQATAAATLLTKPGYSEEDLMAFQRDYGALCSNPLFANALMTKISQDDMVRILSFAMIYEDDEFGNTAQELSASFGSVITLALGGTNADSTMAGTHNTFDLLQQHLKMTDGEPPETLSFDEVLLRRLQECKTVGNTYFDAVGQEIDPDTTIGKGLYGQHYGYEYLSQMFGSAAQSNPNLVLGSAFLDGDDSVARDIVRWDYEHLEELCADGQYGNWGLTQTVPGGRSLGIPGGTIGNTPDIITSMMMLLDEPESLTDNTLGIYSPEHQALEEEHIRRLDSIKDFLTADSPRTGSQYETVTSYLTGHRIVEGSFYGSSDHGEALGEVLSQATMTTDPPAEGSPEYGEWYERDRKAVDIAADFIVGYQDGLDNSGRVFGDENARLRSWAGTILAPHVEGIAGSVSSPDINPDPGWAQDLHVGKRHRIKLSGELADRIVSEGGLLVDLAYDEALPDKTPHFILDDVSKYGRPPALLNLIRATDEAYVAELTNTLEGWSSDEDLRRAETVQRKWAYWLNDVNAALDVKEAVETGETEASNKVFRDIASLGVSVLPGGKLFEPGGVLEWAADQATGQVAPWLIDHVDSSTAIEKAEEAVTSKHNYVERHMQELTYSAIAEASEWGNDPDKQPGSLYGEEGSERFLGDDGSAKPMNQMSVDEVQAFTSFIESPRGHQDTLQRHLIDPIGGLLNDAEMERKESDAPVYEK